MLKPSYIKEAREKKGLSIYDVASRLRLSPSIIKNIEEGVDLTGVYASYEISYKKSIYKLLLAKPAYLATILTTFLINIFYKKKFTDIIGAKLYKTSSVKNIPCNSFHTGFDFEFISRCCKRNLKIGELSIKYKPRANSKDKKITTTDKDLLWT